MGGDKDGVGMSISVHNGKEKGKSGVALARRFGA